jgi:hypothetical protein
VPFLYLVPLKAEVDERIKALNDKEDAIDKQRSGEALEGDVEEQQDLLKNQE